MVKLRDEVYWQTTAAELLGILKAQNAVKPLIKCVISPLKADIAPTAINALIKIHGMTQFFLEKASGELQLYVSPINLDPRNPAIAISTPSRVAADLASKIGLYRTLGWAESADKALNDGRVPTSSDDQSIPRFTWWDHRGTAEWAQYTFERPQRLSAVSVYWWDERRIGRPSWR